MKTWLIAGFTFLMFLPSTEAQFMGSGNALDFDGSNDYVQLGNGFSSIDLPISFCFWIKINNNQIRQAVFYSSDLSSTYQGFWVQFINGSLSINIGDGSGKSPGSRRSMAAPVGSLVPNQWYHFAIVYRSALNGEIYKNGILLNEQYSGSGGFNIQTNTTSGKIGENTSNGWMLDAQIDEMSIWEVALNANQVRSLMCKKLAGNEPGLKGYFQFDANTGNNLVDVSANTNGGTLNGPTWVASSAPVGDRSYHNYGNAGVVRGFSSNNDSAVVQLAGNGTNGIHLYYVDQKPSPLPTTHNVPPSVNHYLGVFAADASRNYNLNYYLKDPALLAPGGFILNRRNHNAANNWTALSPASNPISISNRNAPEQLVITESCPKLQIFAANFNGCDSVTITLPNIYGNIVWQDGDSAQTKTFYSSGNVSVSVVNLNTGCSYTDTTNVQLTSSQYFSYFPTDTTSCDSLSLNVAPPLQNILWHDNNTSRNRTFTQTGLIWFSADDPTTGCRVSDSMNILINNTSNYSAFPADTTVCDSLRLTIGPPVVNVQWSNNATSSTNTIRQSGLIWFIGTDSSTGCLVNDSIQVNVVNTRNYSLLPDDTLVCDSIRLNIGAPLVNISWHDGSTTNPRTFYNQGLVWYTATDTSSGCMVRDSLDIQFLNAQNLSVFRDDTTHCDSLELSIPNTFANVVWSDGSSGNTLMIYQSGPVWITATNTATGCNFSDSINVQIINSSNYSYLPADTAACDSLELTLSSNLVNISWFDGSTVNPKVFYQSQRVWFTAVDTTIGCAIRDTLLITINTGNSAFFPEDTIACDSVLLNISANYRNVQWFDGNTDNPRTFHQPGRVWFTAVDTNNGCTVSDSIDIQLISTGNYSIFPNDTLICNSSNIRLNAHTPGATNYQWSNGSTDSATSFNTPGVKWVQVFLSGNCFFRDSIEISFSPQIEPIAEDKFLLCPGETLDLAVSQLQFNNVNWSNGSTQFSTTYNNSGLEWVSLENLDGCTQTDTFEIVPPADLSIGTVFNDTVFCKDQPFFLKAPDSLYVLWPNGSDSTYYVAKEQVIKVLMNNGCQDTTRFFDALATNCECDVVMPSAFTPNYDGLNDTYGVLANCEYITFDLKIFSRWGTLVFHSKDPDQEFNGRYNGEELPSGVYVYQLIYRTDRVEGERSGHLSLLR